MRYRTTSFWTATILSALAAGLTACDMQRNPGTGVDNPVAQIIVRPDTLTLDPFTNHQFQAFGRTQVGDSVPVTVRWTASAGTISSSGMYTADTSAADATITATQTSSTISGASSVKKRRVIQVVISPKSTTVAAGGGSQFTTYGRRNTGDSVSVSVTYTATGGTISGNGAFSAGQAAGVYKVIARQNGGNLADTSVVTVSAVPVASVDVSPSAPSLQVGQTQQLTATPRDVSGNPLSGRAVTWASSNGAVATVSGSGLVSAVGAGSATISATSEGQSGTAAVIVIVVPVASVSVSPATANLQTGQTVQLSATPRDAGGNALAGRVVTWASSAPAIATVNGSGLVTGVAAGSATITASSEGRNGTAAVTVTATVTNPGTVTNLAVASVTANSVTLSFTEVTNGAGQAASYDIRWSAGSLSWASATDVTQGTCSVPVAGTAIGAARTCTVLGLASGVSYQFQMVAFRGTLNVDAVFGGFSNIASGTTTASTAPVATVTVSPASSNLLVGQSLQLTATLKDASGNTLTGRTVTWSSNLPLGASVNSSGLVNGLLVGLVTITATSEGKSGSSAITVIVSSPSGEPILNVSGGDAVIYQDNMDQYTTPHDMDSWPGYSLHPFYPDLYPNNYAVITSAHGSGGRALRLVYDKGNGDRFIWKTNPENLSTWYAPGNSAFVLQYWFRISKNGGPGGGPGYGSTAVGMKWMELWNVGTNARTQFSVTAGNATTGPLWHVNPASRGPVGYQPVGPYWNQLNNNQWHRVTYLYQPASSAGATDGVARMWVDGTKIVDVSAAAAGITPPGGTKVWCTMAEVAQLDTYQTGMINLGEYMNGGLGDGVTDLPMTLDFDDFVWWKLPVRLP